MLVLDLCMNLLRFKIHFPTLQKLQEEDIIHVQSPSIETKEQQTKPDYRDVYIQTSLADCQEVEIQTSPDCQEVEIQTSPDCQVTQVNPDCREIGIEVNPVYQEVAVQTSPEPVGK